MYTAGPEDVVFCDTVVSVLFPLGAANVTVAPVDMVADAPADVVMVFPLIATTEVPAGNCADVIVLPTKIFVTFDNGIDVEP